MSFWKAGIGGMIGFSIGGPIGGILGAIIGSKLSGREQSQTINEAEKSSCFFYCSFRMFRQNCKS